MPTEEFPAAESSLDVVQELIRRRAFALYEQRGGNPGHDLEDWFKAEAEILGHKIDQPEPELVIFSFGHKAGR